MKNAPYSLTEAEKLCNEYQHLVGQRYDKHSDALIDCVAIAPFDQASKNRFTIFYLLFDDASMALEQEYKGLLYDILVISGPSDSEERRYTDLYTWLEDNNKLPRAGSSRIQNFVLGIAL